MRWITTFLLIVLGVVIGMFVMSVNSAHAQVSEGGVICTDRKGAEDNLTNIFSEARVNMGLASNGQVIEVFATEDGGTFTIIITSPEGLTCILAAGEHWEMVPFKLKKKINYDNPL